MTDKNHEEHNGLYQNQKNSQPANSEIGKIYLFSDIDYNGNIVVTRPLVIVKEIHDGNAYLAFKCTTRERDYDEYSYKLNDWKYANLVKSSSVRCNKPLFVNSNMILKHKDGSLAYIGKVSQYDLQNIAVRFEEYTVSMKQFAEELKEQINSKEYWFIREKTISSNNNEINTGAAKLFNNESDARRSFALCNAERNQIIYGGQVINCETSFELGTVRIRADGSYNESGIKILEQKKAARTIKRCKCV